MTITKKEMLALPFYHMRGNRQYDESSPIPPILILDHSEHENMIEISVSRSMGDEIIDETVTITEACKRIVDFIAEVATDWGGDHGLIAPPDLPRKLSDLIKRLSADSGQQ